MSAGIRLWLCLATIMLYLAAMVLPFEQAIRGRPRFGTNPGWRFFTYGFRDLYAWDRLLEPWDFSDLVVRVSWLANPVTWFAILALSINRPRLSVLFSSFGLVLALFLLADFAPSLIHRPGYWAWVLSAATPLIGWFCVRRRIPADLAADYGPIVTGR